VNDSRIMVGIDRHGHRIHQARQVRGPADFFNFVLFPERVAQRYQIHRFAFGIKGLDGGKNDL
jgi:hypothetical protein